MLRTHRRYATPKLSINVKEVRDHKLIRPMISLRASGSSPAITITAREAELQCDPQAKALIITLREGYTEVEGKASVHFPGTFRYPISLPDASKKGGGGLRNPSYYALRNLPGETQKQQKRIRTLEKSQAAEVAYDMLTGDFEAIGSNQWKNHQRTLDNTQRRLYRLHTEPWRRWANGFSCFFFVLMGIPLAIRMRSSDFLSSFFACFLPILLVYYPLLAFGVDLAKSGTVPPYTVWAGNLAIAFVGIWLLRKIIRY
jgi:lipopolysaccharide export system permease protein